MQKSFHFSVVAVGLFLTGCTQPESSEAVAVGPCALPESDVQFIRDLVAEHEGQVLIGDYETMRTSFAEEAVFMFPNQPAFSGLAQVTEFQNSFPPIDEYELPPLEIVGCGDVAVVRGTYSMSMAMEGLPEPYTDSGNWMHVLRKGDQGEWKIIMDISNSDRPPPMG
jgi:ketosteroid isomerase-like protein